MSSGGAMKSDEGLGQHMVDVAKRLLDAIVAKDMSTLEDVAAPSFTYWGNELWSLRSVPGLELTKAYTPPDSITPFVFLPNPSARDVWALTTFSKGDYKGLHMIVRLVFDESNRMKDLFNMRMPTKEEADRLLLDSSKVFDESAWVPFKPNIIALPKSEERAQRMKDVMLSIVKFWDRDPSTRDFSTLDTIFAPGAVSCDGNRIWEDIKVENYKDLGAKFGSDHKVISIAASPDSNIGFWHIDNTLTNLSTGLRTSMHVMEMVEFTEDCTQIRKLYIFHTAPSLDHRARVFDMMKEKPPAAA